MSLIKLATKLQILNSLSKNEINNFLRRPYENEKHDISITKKYGFIEGSKSEFHNNRIIVDNIAVNPIFRNKGYGSKLINDFIDKIKDKNIDHVHWTAANNNLPSINLALKNNFKIINKDEDNTTLIRKI